MGRPASDIVVIALRAWANESFKVAMTFVLSVVDFFKLFMSTPG
jgi:hypothetical protein